MTMPPGLIHWIEEVEAAGGTEKDAREIWPLILSVRALLKMGFSVQNIATAAELEASRTKDRS